MRMLAVVLLAVGLVALLLANALDDDASVGRTHREGAATEEAEVGPGEIFSGGLRVIDGIARVPQTGSEKSGSTATDTRGRFVFYGFAIRASTREPVVGVEVTVEQVSEDGRREFTQPKGRDRGRFEATVQDIDLSLGELRLVLKSTDAEVAIVPLKLDADRTTTYLGNVVLTGEASLSGRVLDENNAPVEGAKLLVQQFGTLHPRTAVLDRETSDKDGEFTFDHLPRGSFVVQGFVPDGRRLLQAPIVLPQEGEILLRPIPGADFHLRVRNTAREPVTGAAITLIPEPANRDLEPLAPENLLRPAHATTDNNGLATLPQLPRGTYAMIVHTADGALYEHDVEHIGTDKYRFFTWTLPSVELLLFKVPPPPAKPPQAADPVREPAGPRTVCSGRPNTPPQQTRTFADRRPRTPKAVCASPAVARLLLNVGKSKGLDEKARRAAAFVQLARFRETDTAPRSGWSRSKRSRRTRNSPRKRKATSAANVVVRVVTADGVPVQGARVYAEGVRARLSGDEGLVKAPATARRRRTEALAARVSRAVIPEVELAGRESADLVLEGDPPNSS